MKTNSNNSFYLNYEIICNSLVVTVFLNNRSEYVVINEKKVNEKKVNEKKVNRVRRFRVSLKSILTNLYVHVLSFKDISTSTTTPTTSTTAIGVAAETTTSTHATTITTNNNNIIYFIKLRGISQGDPMEGFPLYCGGNRRE